MGKQPVKSKQGRKSNPISNIQKEKSSKAVFKKKKKQQQPGPNPLEDNDPILFESDHGADEEENPSPEDLQRLLEHCSKDQLIAYLTDAAADDPHLLSQIRSAADLDIAHRKIFVRGIGWDVTSEALLEAFRRYGPVLDCNVVVDKTSGRNKGYGFILFSNRSGAVKALKEPEKKIGTRIATCQLSSTRYIATATNPTDLSQRRVYVGNVQADVSPEKLKALFASFGEIESGPTGFDLHTGKSRGFAIFVYKTQDGATRALKEPYKMFEGNQLHCKLAFDHSQKGKLPATPVVAPQSLPVINQQPAVNVAAAAPPNVAMLGQNPAYSMLLVQNPLFTNAAWNPNSLATLNPSALAAFNGNLAAPQGQGYGGLGSGAQLYGGQGHGNPNVFGTYKAQESASLSYRGPQFGQSSSFTPATGFFRTFP